MLTIYFHNKTKLTSSHPIEGVNKRMNVTLITQISEFVFIFHWKFVSSEIIIFLCNVKLRQTLILALREMIDFCSIKEVQKALNELENNFKSSYGICINEASVLCSLSDCCLTSSEIAKCADLRASHTSKTIRSIEDKGLIKRKIGKQDRRLMRFSLTKKGADLMQLMKEDKILIPEILRSLLNKKETTPII